MRDYAAQFTQFLARLEANTQVKLTWKEFDLRAEDLDDSILREINASLAKKFGDPFPLPEDELQLLGLPADRFDIAWESVPDAPLFNGINFQTGCINLIDLSTTIGALNYGNDSYGVPPGILALMDDATLMRHGRLFDAGSAANVTTNLVYVCYEKVQRRFLGLGIEHGRQFLPLQLGIGEYVRAALAWHGGWGWQFLYTSPEDFRQLGGTTLRTLYNLSEALPVLFPEADWSVITSKQAYFDYARQFARR